MSGFLYKWIFVIVFIIWFVFILCGFLYLIFSFVFILGFIISGLILKYFLYMCFKVNIIGGMIEDIIIFFIFLNERFLCLSNCFISILYLFFVLWWFVFMC